MYKRYLVQVSGHVQGVGFRYRTVNFVHQSLSLAVKGHIRNLRNGDVEVYAEGEEDELDVLLNFLKTGPRHSLVTAIHVRELTAEDVSNLKYTCTNGFDIRD